MYNYLLIIFQHFIFFYYVSWSTCALCANNWQTRKLRNFCSSNNQLIIYYPML